MSSYGVTPGFIDRILSAVFDNIPLSISQVCAQIYKGAPGDDGTSNPSQVAARTQVSFSSPSGGSTGLDGSGAPSFIMNLSSPPTETIEAVGLFDDFETNPDAQCMFTAAANPPVLVADGDVLILNAYDIDAQGLAS